MPNAPTSSSASASTRPSRRRGGPRERRSTWWATVWGACWPGLRPQMPDRIASVITLGSPFRGVSVHPSVLRTAELVRGQILRRHGRGVLPDCYTGACTCSFLRSLMGNFPASVRQTAIYTKADGIVDWRVCRTGDPDVDFEVSATHIGLVFNPLVYGLVARRLARRRTSARKPRRTR